MSTITTNIELALSYLKQGKLVAIPTETVYGLAGNAEDESAIQKIYALKKRPTNHPLIMHVAETWELSRWVSSVPDYAQRLIQAFWPGPLTLVMSCKPGQVSPLVTGGQTTVAIRCPKHPVTQMLLERLDFPLVAPSANPFGKISPTTAEHVQYSFKEEELLILDGGRCPLGIESTIIDATDPQAYQILRQGLVSEEEIYALLPNLPCRTSSSIRVPGKLDSHYQPEKPLYCFANVAAIEAFCRQTSAAVYVLSFAKLEGLKPSLSYQLPSTPEEAAYELYYQLRRADQSAAEVIAVEQPPQQAHWQGISERIIKASSVKP